MMGLIGWIVLGLAGIAVSGIMFGAKWRRGNSRGRRTPQSGHAIVKARSANRGELIDFPSASGRQVVLRLAELPDPHYLPVHSGQSQHHTNLGLASVSELRTSFVYGAGERP